MNLAGKVVLVTGATSGIGKEIALQAHAQGATVILHGRNQELLDEILLSFKERMFAVCVDLLEDITCEKLSKEVLRLSPSIDFLVLNAGVFHYSPVEQALESDFDRLMQTNVKSPYFLTNKLIPHINSGGGILINSSITAKKGYPGFSAYNMTKAALQALGRTLSSELVERGISVNTVNPGIIQTPIFEKMKNSKFISNSLVERAVALTPMKRLGTCQEVAKCFIYLMSNDCTFMTGNEVDVDGGLGQV